LTKISVYIDDAIWASFREKVFQKHGNLRKLSSEIESLIRNAIIEDAVTNTFEKIGIKAKGTISSKEIKTARPSLRGPPSEEILTEMRKKRVAETLSRQ